MVEFSDGEHDDVECEDWIWGIAVVKEASTRLGRSLC